MRDSVVKIFLICGGMWGISSGKVYTLNDIISEAV